MLRRDIILGLTALTVLLNESLRFRTRLLKRSFGRLAPSLVRAEIERTRRKPTESLDAYERFPAGPSGRVIPDGPGKRRENAFQEFTRAIELDPQFARAYAGAAMIYVGRKDNNWMVDRPREFAEESSPCEAGR